MSVKIIDPGAHTSVQGLGVRRKAHLGFSRGGAFDERSLRLANLAVGNDDGALGLECTLTGPTFEVRDDDALFAWCGAPGSVTVDGRELAPMAVTTLSPGMTVVLAPRTSGVRVALAFAGGVLKAAGDVLKKGERITIGPATHPARAVAFTPLDLAAPLRCTDAAFTPLGSEAMTRLYGEPFTVLPESSRRGVRLGAAQRVLLDSALQQERPSFGVALGAVQLPPSGQPIVLGVDQTTTGGYPTVASVISADTWRIGQLRPGAQVRFERVTFDEARAAYLAWQEQLALIRGAA
jgi:antagonist of KipI